MHKLFKFIIWLYSYAHPETRVENRSANNLVIRTSPICNHFHYSASVLLHAHVAKLHPYNSLSASASRQAAAATRDADTQAVPLPIKPFVYLAMLHPSLSFRLRQSKL
jgi:hypothetical protein